MIFISCVSAKLCYNEKIYILAVEEEAHEEAEEKAQKDEAKIQVETQ